MRAALRDTLMKKKQSLRHERGKSHVGEDDGDNPDDAEGISRLAQRPGLSRKVDEAEESGMSDLESAHPSDVSSEESDSSQEEMDEPVSEALAEGNFKPGDWREEQKEFMTNKKKNLGGKTAVMISIGTKGKMSGKPIKKG